MVLRVRFFANPDDYRPIKWPIKHPYWCSGYTDDFSVMIAYADTIDEIKELWPEAKIESVEEHDEIVFSERFPKPSWYE